MKLWSIGINHADQNTLQQAVYILERIANRADLNADNANEIEPDDDTDTTEIAEMNREIAEIADRASGAIEDLLYAIQSYDRAGYNDATEEE